MKDTEKNPPIRIYAKAELAQLYNPDASPDTAVRTLTRWIRHNRSLTTALEKIEYRKTRHYFLSAEVKLIFHYLGMP